jgi:hypothetical protein
MSHTQDDDKVNCSGDPARTSPVFIRVTDEEDADDTRGRMYFEGTLALGDTFLASAEAAGDDRFRSRTYTQVFAADGELLQSVEFHTSCSQPLEVGNQLGSIAVSEFFAEEDGEGSRQNKRRAGKRRVFGFAERRRRGAPLATALGPCVHAPPSALGLLGFRPGFSR